MGTEENWISGTIYPKGTWKRLFGVKFQINLIYFYLIFSEITSWVGIIWNRELDPWEQQQRAGTDEIR